MGGLSIVLRKNFEEPPLFEKRTMKMGVAWGVANQITIENSPPPL